MISNIADNRNFRDISGGNTSRSSTNNVFSSYKGFNYENRTIISSPEYQGTSNSEKLKIPVPYINKYMNSGSSENSKRISYFNNDNNIQMKTPQYKSFSPSFTEVSMPNGVIYTVREEQFDQNFTNNSPSYMKSNFIENENNLKSKKVESDKNSFSYIEDEQYKKKNEYTPKTLSPRGIKKTPNVTINEDLENNYNTEKESNYKRKSKNRSHKKRSNDIEDSDDSDDSESESSRERRKEEKMIIRLLLEDYKKRKENEKTEESNKNKQNNIPSAPGFQIPTSEPIEQKSKIPNYEMLSDLDKDKIKEKFRNNYNMLVVKYPKWKIELPDFNVLPLKLIHERYEQVVKTICIYQTAMKWKVYLVLIIALIEWYGHVKKGYVFLNGLLKAQIKTIHKFDTYLIEFAEKFYSDDDGEEYPLWIRSLGTFITGVVSFCSINGAAKTFGKNATPPDFIFEQIDKFVSPPEGTAKLHSDGISDVPEPPTGWQDPNSLIGMIGQFFSGFGGSKPTSDNRSQTSSIEPQKAKPVDDFDDVEL